MLRDRERDRKEESPMRRSLFQGDVRGGIDNGGSVMAATTPPASRLCRRTRPVAVAALLAALASSVLIRAASPVQSVPAPAAGPPPINAVYFADAERPGIDPALARGRGVRVVGSARELAAEAISAHAIVIDRDAFETVDPQWLAGQLAEGRAIVAINVSGDQLGPITGYPRSVTTIPAPAVLQGRSFYSAVWAPRKNGASRHWVSGSDVLYDPQSFLRKVYLLTPAGQADSNAPPVPTPQTAPPTTRPRP